MDDDYHEYTEPTPTFSGGSGGRRGANIMAEASRAHAAKNAISAASRAANIVVSNMHQSHNKVIITANGIRQTNTAPPINKESMRAAQKRAQMMVSTPAYTKPPVQKSEPVVFIRESPPKIPKEYGITSEIHASIVRMTRFRKQALLSLHTIQEPPKKLVKYRTKSIEVTWKDTELPVDTDSLDTLYTNLTEILKNPSDKLQILNEFKRYQSCQRISSEQLAHKKTIINAAEIKSKYLTSDT